jgi:hypothetical protein
MWSGGAVEPRPVDRSGDTEGPRTANCQTTSADSSLPTDFCVIEHPAVYNYTVDQVELPVQPGHVSPDGMWRWDGQAWMPTPAAVRQPQASRSTARARRIVFVAVLCTAGVTAIFVALASQIQIGTRPCVPGDFPTYPGASVSSALATKGSTPDCFMVLHTKDAQLTAVQFYESALDTGDWRVTSVSSTTGTIKFERRSTPQTAGSVSFVAHTGSTNIYIRLMVR